MKKTLAWQVLDIVIIVQTVRIKVDYLLIKAPKRMESNSSIRRQYSLFKLFVVIKINYDDIFALIDNFRK